MDGVTVTDHHRGALELCNLGGPAAHRPITAAPCATVLLAVVGMRVIKCTYYCIFFTLLVLTYRVYQVCSVHARYSGVFMVCVVCMGCMICLRLFPASDCGPFPSCLLVLSRMFPFANCFLFFTVRMLEPVFYCPHIHNHSSRVLPLLYWSPAHSAGSRRTYIFMFHIPLWPGPGSRR